MDRAEAVALLENRRDAWLAEDVETYLGLFAEDFVFDANGVEQSHGWTTFANDIRKNHERFRPIAWNFHDIAVSGSHVLSEYSLTVEDRRSGKRLSLEAMQVCEIREGLTMWIREYRTPVR